MPLPPPKDMYGVVVPWPPTICGQSSALVLLVLVLRSPAFGDPDAAKVAQYACIVSDNRSSAAEKGTLTVSAVSTASGSKLDERKEC